MNRLSTKGKACCSCLNNRAKRADILIYTYKLNIKDRKVGKDNVGLRGSTELS